MNNNELFNRIIIGICTIFLITAILLIFSIVRKKRKIPINEEIFGEIFIRSLFTLFPAAIIITKDIYQFFVIIVCLIFGSILNTQYFMKIKERKIMNKNNE